MIRKLVLLLVLVISFFSTQAQRISGIIRDASTNESIIGASVLLKGTSNAVTTDIDGKFEIVTESKPPYDLVITYIGFEPQEVKVPDVTNKPMSPSLFRSPVKLRMSSTGTDAFGLCFT